MRGTTLRTEPKAQGNSENAKFNWMREQKVVKDVDNFAIRLMERVIEAHGYPDKPKALREFERRKDEESNVWTFLLI